MENIFKIGDKVRIKQVSRDEIGFHFLCCYGMEKECGKIGFIAEIKKYPESSQSRTKVTNDSCGYVLKELNGRKGDFTWPSSMLELIIEEDPFFEDVSYEGLYEEDSDSYFEIPFDYKKKGLPVIYKEKEALVYEIDKDDRICPIGIEYSTGGEEWIGMDEYEEKDLRINIPKLLEKYKYLIQNNPMFGKIKITKQESKDYPLYVELSDGDAFELTIDGKFFKECRQSILWNLLTK